MYCYVFKCHIFAFIIYFHDKTKLKLLIVLEYTFHIISMNFFC